MKYKWDRISKTQRRTTIYEFCENEAQKLSKFLLNSLVKSEFEKLSNFINPKLVIKSCEILFASKEYNCGKMISSLEFKEIFAYNVFAFFYFNFFLFSNWNTTQNDSLIKTERFANLDKVVIRIKRIGRQIFLSMNSNYDIEYDKNVNFDNVFSIDDKKYSNIHFETNSIQKLNTNHYKCNESRNDRTLFTHYYSNDCE